MADPKEMSDAELASEMAKAGKQMQHDKSDATEDALDRSLAVQGEDGEDTVVGADEEE